MYSRIEVEDTQYVSTGIGRRMSYRKWRETKEQLI